MVEPEKSNIGYINRSIGTMTGSRFGNRTAGTDDRLRMIRQAHQAINVMSTDKLKEVVTDLQDKSGIKKK